MTRKSDKKVDGNSILKSTYSFTLARHSEPDIELAGHYWEFVEFMKIDELKQLA